MIIKILLSFLIIQGSLGQFKTDSCSGYQSYYTCINSKESKCFWNLVQSQCLITQNYLLGCDPSLNKPACISQLGDVLGNLAKCRFKTKCEVLQDPTKENCESNLNKSGCLSVANPTQICLWKDSECALLKQEEWNEIGKNFDSVLYSVSACSHIENYLVIHHLLLWDLIKYTPNLMLQANNAYLEDFGIQSADDTIYDNPDEVFLQNNFVRSDGTFEWYSIRESKSIILRNLKISDRYREGCIALEIENDSDYEMIFNLNGQIFGVNHVYCKYLNKKLTSQPYYVFSQQICEPYDQSFLNDQYKIEEYQLTCKSLSSAYCIYFESINYICEIKGEVYEYPCQLNINQDYQTCDLQCTIQQCKMLDNFYIDNNSNLCVSTCYDKQSQYDCEFDQICVYLGDSKLDQQIRCSPLLICDQPGVSYQSCKYLRAKCMWNENLQRCYTLADDEIQYLKCSDAINAFVCTFVTLSDQLCFWESKREKCMNLLDQPLLITYQLFIGFVKQTTPGVFNLYTICNLNLCKINDLIYSLYDEEQRLCKFSYDLLLGNQNLLGKYTCLTSQPGFCQWNQLMQSCDCLQKEFFSKFQCSDLINVNEKWCQFGMVSNEDKICIYQAIEYSCYEANIEELSNLKCEGNGLSQLLCLKNSFCQYIDFLCSQVDQKNMNFLSCQIFHNINSDVCAYHNKDAQLCDFDEKTNSCYSPSILNDIKYKTTLNRFACERVVDYPTYYDIVRNFCTIFDDSNNKFFHQFLCEGYYLSKMACYQITTDGQFCYWSDSQQKCLQKIYEFTKCSDYSIHGARVCQALERSQGQALQKENFCSFSNNECLSNITIIQDCGTDELMNIHRCNGRTGLDSNNLPIQMCAFIDSKCISLNENSYNDQLILNTIQCKQANFASCVKITTPGQFCRIAINKSINAAILDQKCEHQNNLHLTCEELYKNYELSQINKNFCSQARNSCHFEENIGCTAPAIIDLPCDNFGLSQTSCFNNTNNHRCIYQNNYCQYLSENVIIKECDILNKFLCQNYKYSQCIWKENKCFSDDNLENVTAFSCQSNVEEVLQVYQDNQCVTILEDDLDKFSCDSPGLNQFSCSKIKSQYCVFNQNQCQFYRNILCEDDIQNCSANSTGLQKCILLDDKCFDFPTRLQYECDELDETNYEFCYQYPQCVYNSNKCFRKYFVSYFCLLLQNIVDCTYQQPVSLCNFDIETQTCEFLTEVDHCLSFEGYYSPAVCASFSNCHFGNTKSGFGFCYEGNINEITCEQISELFCTEDFYHLNENLNCYFDQQCKTLQIEQATCAFLSQYPSNYPACRLVSGNQKCMYSHIDHFCKKTAEFTSTVCTGSTNAQCSLIQNICYFENGNCNDQGSQDIYLNKYGCLIQEGFWQFQNYQCINLQSESIVQSCNSISKQVCLSQITKELYCRWDEENKRCSQVLENEVLQISSCLNLNEKTCINVKLSQIQCFWDKDLNQCKEFQINQTDCSFNSNGIKVSLSLCSNLKNHPCIRSENGEICEILETQIDSCSKYGLNEIACINNTTNYCQWYQDQNGGYCKDVNLITAYCNERLNKQSCFNIQTRGQYCFWNDSEKRCEEKVISDCQSASQLNQQYPCFSVQTEKCYYNYFTNECLKLNTLPNGCQEKIYNKESCLSEGNECSWIKNKCQKYLFVGCNQLSNRQQCLNQNKLACEWKNEECIDFQNEEKTHCLYLPTNISDVACKQSSNEPCQYSNQYDKCITITIITKGHFYSISKLLSFQDEEYTSPILSGQCEEQQNTNDCVKARKQSQPCIWNNGCSQVIDFSQLQCLDQLNIFGCLGVVQQNQYCVWSGKCFEWDKSINQTNVNINVCKYYSVNKIYKNSSCVTFKIDDINCEDLGISKVTCLSITKYQCQWNDNLDSCEKFQYQNQQECKEYKNVSLYVCQMQQTDKCIFNRETKTCEKAPKNSLIRGISQLTCLENDEQAIYWDGEICQIFNLILECNVQLKVNQLACINRITQPCIYDVKQQICTSKYNNQSLRCNTFGANKLACVQIQTEPCIFLNGKCQEFTNYYYQCDQLQNVNSKTCSSIKSEQCEYNFILNACQTPKTSKQLCNIEGSNQILCQTKEGCDWNQDYLNCKCKINQVTEQCQKDKVSDCKSNSSCIYENNICKLKQCYHLQENECNNQFLQGNICYFSFNMGCQSAQTCEDIINTKFECSIYFINSIQCLQGLNNSCYSYNNYGAFCPNSDCLISQCIKKDCYCRQKLCSDYGSQECLNQQGCYYNSQNQCDNLITCNQITENMFGSAASLICNQAKVNSKNCNWQLVSFFDQKTKVCTNQYCRIFGSSKELCHGNEINSVSCVIQNDFSCKSCEEITEECFCNQYVNVCQFSNGTCNSILCQSFATMEECQQSGNRCYWSGNKYNGVCVIDCNKVFSIDECNSRIGQCYYDYAIDICKQGQQFVPDLSIEITIEQFLGKILEIIIIIILFIE